MTMGIEHLIWMLDERLARAEQSAIDSQGAPNSYGHGYDEGFWEALVDARVMAETLLTKSDGGVESRHAECPQGRSCARAPHDGHGTSGQATIAGVAPGPSELIHLADNIKTRGIRAVEENPQHLSLIERLLRQEAGAWQDIKTAPVAGTKIDVWAVSAAGYGVRWPDVTWGAYTSVWLGAPIRGDEQHRWKVTHWRPLPAPPMPPTPSALSSKDGTGGAA